MLGREKYIAIAKLKKKIDDQVVPNSTELIQAKSEIFYSEIQKLVNYIWNKEELPEQ
jgi:hypothetical protein